jgi:hypothetical protein
MPVTASTLRCERVSGGGAMTRRTSRGIAKVAVMLGPGESPLDMVSPSLAPAGLMPRAPVVVGSGEEPFQGDPRAALPHDA